MEDFWQADETVAEESIVFEFGGNSTVTIESLPQLVIAVHDLAQVLSELSSLLTVEDV